VDIVVNIEEIAEIRKWDLFRSLQLKDKDMTGTYNS
jgi:hypothetical protein